MPPPTFIPTREPHGQSVRISNLKPLQRTEPEGQHGHIFGVSRRSSRDTTMPPGNRVAVASDVDDVDVCDADDEADTLEEGGPTSICRVQTLVSMVLWSVCNTIVILHRSVGRADDFARPVFGHV